MEVYILQLIVGLTKNKNKEKNWAKQKNKT